MDSGSVSMLRTEEAGDYQFTGGEWFNVQYDKMCAGSVLEETSFTETVR